MTAFQWLAGGLMSSLILLEFTLQFAGKTRRSISTIRALVWILALLLILAPNATNRIADFLSIGRGADVLLYGTVISFLLSFFYLLHAIERQREQITLLVRRIALDKPYFAPAKTTTQNNLIAESNAAPSGPRPAGNDA
jgi:hypothetical protein